MKNITLALAMVAFSTLLGYSQATNFINDPCNIGKYLNQYTGLSNVQHWNTSSEDWYTEADARKVKLSSITESATITSPVVNLKNESGKFPVFHFRISNYNANKMRVSVGFYSKTPVKTNIPSRYINGFVYYDVRDLQKALHKDWQNIDCFSTAAMRQVIVGLPQLTNEKSIQIQFLVERIPTAGGIMRAAINTPNALLNFLFDDDLEVGFCCTGGGGSYGGSNGRPPC